MHPVSQSRGHVQSSMYMRSLERWVNPKDPCSALSASEAHNTTQRNMHSTAQHSTAPTRRVPHHDDTNYKQQQQRGALHHVRLLPAWYSTMKCRPEMPWGSLPPTCTCAVCPHTSQTTRKHSITQCHTHVHRQRPMPTTSPLVLLHRGRGASGDGPLEQAIA